MKNNWLPPKDASGIAPPHHPGAERDAAALVERTWTYRLVVSVAGAGNVYEVYRPDGKRMPALYMSEAEAGAAVRQFNKFRI